MPERRKNIVCLSFTMCLHPFIHSIQHTCHIHKLYLQLLLILIYLGFIIWAMHCVTRSLKKQIWHFQIGQILQCFNLNLYLALLRSIKDLNVTKYIFDKCQNLQALKCDSHVLFFDHINLLGAGKLILEQHFYLRKRISSYKYIQHLFLSLRNIRQF